MYEHYYPLGIDAWWMDASEPEYCVTYRLGISEGFVRTYGVGFLYGIFQYLCTDECEEKPFMSSQRGVDNNKRVFMMTRSGFCRLRLFYSYMERRPVSTHWGGYEGTNFCRTEFCHGGGATAFTGQWILAFCERTVM